MKAKIMFVDDEREMRILARDVLSEKFDLVTAKNAAEAIALFKTQRPDLILTDAIMPMQDGLSLLAMLKDLVPIVVFSGNAQALNVARECGAKGVIAKPLDVNGMISTIENLLDASQARSPKMLIIDENESETKIMERVLSKNGFEIVVARGRKAGLGLLAELKPSVVAINALVDNKEGFNLARQIKERDTFQAPIVILYCVEENEAFAKIARGTGCDAFLMCASTKDLVTLITKMLA